jgi:hypothetical protein
LPDDQLTQHVLPGAIGELIQAKHENQTKPDSNPGAVCGDAGLGLLKRCIPKADFWRGLFPRHKSNRAGLFRAEKVLALAFRANGRFTEPTLRVP